MASLRRWLRWLVSFFLCESVAARLDREEARSLRVAAGLTHVAIDITLITSLIALWQEGVGAGLNLDLQFDGEGLQFVFTSDLTFLLVYNLAWLLMRLGKAKGGRILLGFAVIANLATLTHYHGLPSGTHFYFFPAFAASWMIFTPREKAFRYLLTFASVACFLFFLYHFEVAGATPLDARPDLEATNQIYLLVNASLAIFALGAAVYYFYLAGQRAEAQLDQERKRSDDLLLNILPAPVAQRLKLGEQLIADRYESATVLFADIVNFTPLSARLAPEDLVRLLNRIFSDFDALADRFQLEKIKTIGDAYLAVGGVPQRREGHAIDIIRMALAMQQSIDAYQMEGETKITLRIGVHSGPLVAGVIGRRKFIYDLWGDTVNTASRMESQGLPGRIHLTEPTRLLLGDQFALEDRGEMEIKGKGLMRTYLLGPTD